MRGCNKKEKSKVYSNSFFAIIILGRNFSYLIHIMQNH